MKQYLEQLKFVLENGSKRLDRTGVGTLAAFGLTARYRMSDGFPAVTTKKLVWKSMISELLWFISGSGNINDLREIYSHNKLWDLNFIDYCNRLGIETNHSNGDMGRTYGVQWRKWSNPGGSPVDQLQEAIDLLRNNPSSRRIIVNAWNAAEIGSTDVALPPCHSSFQLFVSEGKLSLLMYQRSGDMFLGVPLNIASYALLLHLIAYVTNLEPHELIHTIGDAHIYLDTIEQCQLQLSREPFPLPELQITDRGQVEIDDFRMEDFSLTNYQHHDAIKAKMAV